MDRYVAVDLETTGLNPARDRILEIGAVKIRDGQEAGQFQMLINPRMEIPERIRELTGITDEMVKGQPSAGEAMEAFAAEQGVDYVDFDTEEIRAQVGLDPAVDYYDQGHVNLTGSVKVSEWLGNYLDQTYDLPDHRGEEAYAQWDIDLQAYLERTGLS